MSSVALMAKPKSQPKAEPLPAHVPLAAEVPAHVVQDVVSDCTLTVVDATNGGVASYRLAVTDDMTLIIVSDP